MHSLGQSRAGESVCQCESVCVCVCVCVKGDYKVNSIIGVRNYAISYYSDSGTHFYKDIPKII